MRSFLALLITVTIASAGCSASRPSDRSSPERTSTPTKEAPSSTLVGCPPTARYTQAQLDAARKGAESLLNGGALSVGFGDNAVVVELFPGQEAAATALSSRFGPIVQVSSIGTVSYHCGVPGTSRKCPDLHAATLPPGLHLTLELPAQTLSATARSTLEGRLVIREDSATPFSIDPGQPVNAAIVKPGTLTVVGSYGGPIAGTGIDITLANGHERAIETIVGAWRCDGSPGSTLPPGRYGVRAGIGPNEGPAEFLAPELPITITP